MRFRVFGLDCSSGKPRAPLLIEAESEDAARSQATSRGMQVEEIELDTSRGSETDAVTSLRYVLTAVAGCAGLAGCLLACMAMYSYVPPKQVAAVLAFVSFPLSCLVAVIASIALAAAGRRRASLWVFALPCLHMAIGALAIVWVTTQ